MLRTAFRNSTRLAPRREALVVQRWMGGMDGPATSPPLAGELGGQPTSGGIIDVPQVRLSPQPPCFPAELPLIRPCWAAGELLPSTGRGRPAPTAL